MPCYINADKFRMLHEMEGGGRQHADYQVKRIKKEHKDAHNFCHKEVVSAVHGGCSYILIITKNRHKGSAFCAYNQRLCPQLFLGLRNKETCFLASIPKLTYLCEEIPLLHYAKENIHHFARAIFRMSACRLPYGSIVPPPGCVFADDGRKGTPSYRKSTTLHLEC